MARKRYYFKDHNKVGVSTTYMPGTKKKISIGAQQNDYRTSDPAEQKFIESHPFFKGKVISKIVDSLPGEVDNAPAPKKPTATKPHIGGGDGDTLEEKPDPDKNPDDDGDGTPNPDKQGAGHEPAVFPDVVDINGAVAVLKGEPYNIPHQSLRTPEKVMAHAAEQNVSFPNLK